MRDLADLVQSLPGELYDEILDLTLTPDTDFVPIDKDYCPPAQLQISRACRRTYRERYYKNTTFTLEDSSEEHSTNWAKSLVWDTTRKIACVWPQVREMTVASVTGPRVVEEISRPKDPARRGPDRFWHRENIHDIRSQLRVGPRAKPAKKEVKPVG